MSFFPSYLHKYLIRAIIIIILIGGAVGICIQIKGCIVSDKPSKSEILEFVKDCKWGDNFEKEGNYASCIEMKQLSKKYKNDSFITQKYKSLEYYYSDLTPILLFPKPIMPSGDGVTFCMGKELKTSDIQAESGYAWFTSAWGSYLLRDRRETSVPERLINIIKNNTSAAVKEMAIDSYSTISGYKKESSLQSLSNSKIYLKNFRSAFRPN